MKVLLTQRQIDQLMPYFDRVRAAHVLGEKGMLVAQLTFDSTRMQYYLTPAFVPRDKALLITECGRDPYQAITTKEGGEDDGDTTAAAAPAA